MAIVPGFRATARHTSCDHPSAERKDEQARKTLRRQDPELTLLIEASQALNSTLDLDQVLVTTLKEMRRLLEVTTGSIWLIDSATGELVRCQTIGLQDDTDQRISQVPHAALCVPLRVKGKVIGALQAVNTELDCFSETSLALLEMLANSAALAIDNAQQIKDLRRRTLELEAANKELEAFAHTIAHNLKNPLGVIVGFAELLKQDGATMLSEELRQYLTTIVRNGRKMQNIVNQLLLLAGSHNMEIELEPLDMARVVNQALERLVLMIEEYQAEIAWPDAWPAALGYGPWVEEVWDNYIGNAIKYGGRPPRVKLGATTQADGTVRFWVQDDGQGLTPEDQARLFAPFTQLNPDGGKGHGLGLSIVRGIVEKLGGQVGIESAPGQGSVFFFTLPGVSIEDGRR